MGSREVSRRGVLKTGAALASVGVLGSLSGCSSVLEDGAAADSDSSAGDIAADIPGRANVVMSMSFDAILDDQAVRGAVNSALSEHSSGTPMMPSSVSGALEMIEQQSGVDPRKLNDVVLFGESDADGYKGWLTYTDWSQEELQSLIEGETEVAGQTPNDRDYDLTTETYGNTTVYVASDGDETMRAAVLSDGTVVMGRGGAATAVIDLRNGNGDPISGEVLRAWNATSGEYATVAMDITPEELPDGRIQAAAPTVRNIEYAYGSVYADGDKRGVQFNMETSSEQDASDVATFVRGQIASAKGWATDARTEQLLDELTVSTDGATVTVSTDVDVAIITPAIERFVALFVLRSERSTAVSPDGTSMRT